MKAREIIEFARDWLDDEVEPYLWSDDKLLRYLNEAEKEACRRQRLLYKNDYSISVVADTATYTLDSGLIELRNVRYSNKPVTWKSQDGLDDASETWKTATGATPESFMVEGRSITFQPVPNTTWTIAYEGWRLPTNDINDMEDSPEIAEEFHIELAHWVCRRAFSKTGSEENDEKRAALHDAEFQRMFGRPVPAGVRTHLQRGPQSLKIRPMRYTPKGAIYDSDADLDW